MISTHHFSDGPVCMKSVLRFFLSIFVNFIHIYPSIIFQLKQFLFAVSIERVPHCSNVSLVMLWLAYEEAFHWTVPCFVRGSDGVDSLCGYWFPAYVKFDFSPIVKCWKGNWWLSSTSMMIIVILA